MVVGVMWMSERVFKDFQTPMAKSAQESSLLMDREFEVCSSPQHPADLPTFLVAAEQGTDEGGGPALFAPRARHCTGIAGG